MVKLKLVILIVIIVALSGCMEDVIRVVDTYPIQYIHASNISTTGATSTAGNLQNISDINGGYFNVSEGNAQPFYVIVNFTNITNFSFVEVKSKYFSVSGTPSSHVVDLEIYCSTDDEYEDVFFLENANEWRYFTRHFPDSMHFIDAQGNVSIKFNHTANGNVNHRLYIDTVRLIIKESFEQNTVTLYQYYNISGCVGDCSFNNLSANAFSKNNTLDSYGVFINLKSPIKTIYNDIENFIDMRNGVILIESVNLTSGNSSHVSVSPEYATIDSSNGTANEIVVNQAFTQFNFESFTMKYNGTDFNMGGANLTNCSNCGGNQNLSQVLAVSNDAKEQNITNVSNIYQEYSEIIMSINNNCQDAYPPDTTLYCPRTLQKLSTNYSDVYIRHRLNPANQNYGITLNYNESGYLDNSSMAGWGIFYRATSDDFYIGRFTGAGVALAEFVWRCQNNASCTFYNNFTVTKNLTVSNLAGTGIRPLCADPSGTIIICP